VTNESPTAKPTVYRGAGTFIGGLLVVVLCLLGALDLLIEAGTQDLPGAAVLLLVGSLAFVYGVYPAAFSGEDTLVVRNPFRIITLPWPTVIELAARLSFLVYTENAKFTVWAVPVSLRERRKMERDRLKNVARERREVQRAERSGGSTSIRRSQDRIERLTYADQAVAEMTARRDQYGERIRVAALRAAAAQAAAADQAGAAQAESARTDGAQAAAGAQTEVTAETANTVLVRWAPVPFAVVGGAVLLLILAFTL
jgi:hypothetical protein